MHFNSAYLAFALLLISPSILSVSASPSLAPTIPSDVDTTNPPVEEKKRSADSVTIVKPNENCTASPGIEYSGDPSTKNGCGPKSDGYRRMSRRSEGAGARARRRSWTSNEPRSPTTTDEDQTPSEKSSQTVDQRSTPAKVTKRDPDDPYIIPSPAPSMPEATQVVGAGGSTKDSDALAEIWKAQCAEGLKTVCLKRNAKV